MNSDAAVAFRTISSNADADTRIIWAHGWGQSGQAFEPLATAFAARAENLLIDFPGFGASPLPPDAWSTGDYADAVERWLGTLPPVTRTIWVGHSFGCRVGIQLAARHPERLERMVLIAAAGLKRKRTPVEQLRFRWRTTSFKLLKRLYTLTGRDPAVLSGRYGSADYRNAGALRPIFVKVISEDLSDVARRISCPVQLVFGSNDAETPPEFGTRYNSLIAGSKLAILDHQDHYTVLGDGRHAVAKIISDFIKPNS